MPQKKASPDGFGRRGGQAFIIRGAAGKCGGGGPCHFPFSGRLLSARPFSTRATHAAKKFGQAFEGNRKRGGTEWGCKNSFQKTEMPEKKVGLLGCRKRGIRWKMGVKMGKESRFNLSANESFKQNREKFPFKTGAHS